ncbi:MAG: hypothetical protein NTW86_28785 [Candidatus Sumerlaeota bacterium]|nr:hypothetical protein [Candidatus Sumerlaeota bacterium]
MQTTKVEAVATEPFFYSTRPTVMIRDLELPARSSRCFQLEFVREAQSAGGPNALLYSRTAVQNPDDPFSWKIENETVAGTVVNETDVELRDAAVIALGRAYELKDLPPGQAVALRCDKTQGVALDLWSSMAKTARTSKEMSASASIAEAGRMILAGQLSADPGEACLVGWTEANPAAFTAYSRSGQPPIFPWRSSAATWRVIRYPTCVAGGEIHLESGDFDVEGWNLDEKHFHWNARVEFYDANARVDDQWMIRFRPRLKFVSGGGQSQWPVETAWGNLKDNWEGKPMEVFDFSQGRWALAPAPRNGRRILPPRAGAIDQQTGELWIRLSGATVFMRDVKIDLTLNYRLRP